MEKIQVGIYDNLTGQNIVRDASDEEIASLKAQSDATIALQAEADAKAQADAKAKSALLNRLGITAEEAALLLG
jgi:hypothetical protein